MHSVEKLEKLQNTNKTPMFLTWSSDRYGKYVPFIVEFTVLSIRMESSFH